MLIFRGHQLSEKTELPSQSGRQEVEFFHSRDKLLSCARILFALHQEEEVQRFTGFGDFSCGISQSVQKVKCPPVLS